MTELERLRERIRAGDGVESRHVRSVPVHETYEGQTVWEGVVEVFELDGHPKATYAYAWSHEGDHGHPVDVVVLGVPPIDSPENAVRAAVVAEIKRKRE
jgi:hypothetical protein